MMTTPGFQSQAAELAAHPGATLNGAAGLPNDHPEQPIRHRLRTDPAFRESFLSEAIASFAVEGITISPEEAEACLEEMLRRPPVQMPR